MKIDADISILAGKSGVKIEIHDRDSGICFFRGRLDPKQFCMAMGQLSNCEMESGEVFSLDKVGKKMEWKKFEFPIGKTTYDNRKDVATIECLKNVPDGWHPDLHFNAKDSFFTRDGVEYARVTIRRWVDVERPSEEEE